ncbi:hypothetical protein ABFS83_05G101300 [Erythranthe nasuta]
MLAGCPSTLLSPRHRLRSEACHHHSIPTMSTQRLDLPCTTFPRKDSSRAPPVRPVGLSVEKPVEAKTVVTGCSIKLRDNRDDFWEKSKNQNKKKRFAAEVSFEDDDDDSDKNYMDRVKRKRCNNNNAGGEEEQHQQQQHLSLGSESFWFHPGFISTPQLPFSISCSDEEENRVCFVPSDVILAPPPLPPLSNIPWFQCKKNFEGGPTYKKEASGSSSSTSLSSESDRGLVLSNPVGRVVGNGSSPSGPSGARSQQVSAANQENNNAEENECVELIDLLVTCTEQMGSKNIASVNHCLARLGAIASPRGPTPTHRLVAYFTEALSLRAARLWPQIFHVTAPREEEDGGTTALRALNQVSPIPKFVHFTSNEILLRTFEGKDRVHIIDFDVKQGLQWPSLFQSLASRRNPPSHVRITGVGESKQELIETGDRLSGFADALNIPFEFHPVVDRLEDVRLWMLHVKEKKETVAVNCLFQLHKMLYDTTTGGGGGGAALRDFLSLIKSTNAEAVVIAEQEGAHNGVDLESRVSNSLKYYSAIFDSVDPSLPLESKARIKIEEMFGKEIRNIVACEGRERVERHEGFDRWREMIGREGFRCTGIEEREVLQGQMMLKMTYGGDNYSVVTRDENGAASVSLSWLDQPLYTVSAWKAVDFEGGSSSSYTRIG